MINLRIKDRGTPGGQPRKASPVAVVRPMKSGVAVVTNENKENVAVVTNENKENVSSNIQDKGELLAKNDDENDEVVLADIVDPTATTTTTTQPELKNSAVASPKLMKKAASQPSLRKSRLSTMSVRPMGQKVAQKSLSLAPRTESNSAEKPPPQANSTVVPSEEPQKPRRVSSIPKQGAASKFGIQKSKSEAALPAPVLAGGIPKVGRGGGGAPKSRLKSKQLSQSASSKLLPSKPATAQVGLSK